jgi:GGDEF domain-containing protein
MPAQMQRSYIMPRKFEMMEAALLLFCGGYGLLVTLLLMKAAAWPLLICGCLLGLGLLRWKRPVRSKLQWSLDALLCVALVAALFADSRTGGGSGPYLFLVLLMAMIFPLMMEISNALFFAALLLLVYASLGKSNAAAVPLTLFVLRGILITGMCGLSALFGRMLRSSEEKIEQLRIDLRSGAYNEHGWLRYGERLVAQCRAQEQPLSLVLLPMPPTWQEQIMAEYGMVNPNPVKLEKLKTAALRDMANTFSAALPQGSLVGRDAQGHWVLIAPYITRQDLLARLERRLGRPIQLEFGPAELEMFVSLMPCIVQLDMQESLTDLHARALDIWGRALRTGVVE